VAELIDLSPRSKMNHSLGRRVVSAETSQYTHGFCLNRHKVRPVRFIRAASDERAPTDVIYLMKVSALFSIGRAAIQRVANAEGEFLQGDRLLNQLDIEVHPTLVDDRVARISRHEKDLQFGAKL
jgi:hypothetical protein